MLSYNHMGMNTMNQDHVVRPSKRKTSKIRKIRQINHVHKALCSTAILILNEFQTISVLLTQPLVPVDHLDTFQISQSFLQFEKRRSSESRDKRVIGPNDTIQSDFFHTPWDFSKRSLVIIQSTIDQFQAFQSRSSILNGM